MELAVAVGLRLPLSASSIQVTVRNISVYGWALFVKYQLQNKLAAKQTKQIQVVIGRDKRPLVLGIV